MMLAVLECASKTNDFSQLEILVSSGETRNNLILVIAFMVMSLTPANTFSFQFLADACEGITTLPSQ